MAGMLFRVTSVAGMLLACTACSGMGGEDVSVSQEPLVTVDAWTSHTYSNGQAPVYPDRPAYISDAPGNTVCSVYDSGDNRYHPGKMWSGTCRYVYGTGVKYGASYYILEDNSPTAPFGYIQEGTGSGQPQGVITGQDGSLPVCDTKAAANERATGEVWNRQCLYEYGGTQHYASVFNFLLPYVP
jgi:hypothetical protein